jgi:hypothetical protein
LSTTRPQPIGFFAIAEFCPQIVEASLHVRLTCVDIESVRFILVVVRRQGATGPIPRHLAQIEPRFHDLFQLLDLLIQSG